MSLWRCLLLQARERELLQSCDHNPYLHAMAAMAVARCQPDPARQAALLEVAAQQLVAAQSAEAALLSSMALPGAAGSRGGRGQPWQPKLVCRSSHSVAVKAFPVVHWSAGVLGQSKPAAFAVYCKVHGAGVGLTINKASMEYEGEWLLPGSVLPGGVVHCQRMSSISQSAASP